jgi:hypothetical protein
MVLEGTIITKANHILITNFSYSETSQMVCSYEVVNPTAFPAFQPWLYLTIPGEA